MNSRVHHIAIRFSDTLFSVGDVVERHNNIVEIHGAVWFGKMGSAFSASRVEMLNEQIEQEIPTFVYLVKGNRQKSTVYKATIFAVSKEIPKHEKALIPPYYVEKSLLGYMNSWIRIGHIDHIDISFLKNLIAGNSIFPLEETLARSSAGYFLVHQGKSIF
jgi:hypothetical protein